MGVQKNKDVVRRFVTQVLAGGDFGQIDDVLAPDYVNRAFDANLEAFKGMLAGLGAALPERRFEIEELVGEGDVVVARFTGEMRDGSGNAIPYRGLTYYRLADGRIVEDDPMTTPDLAQALAPYMAPPET